MYRCRGRVVGLALGMAMLGHLGFILVFYFAVPDGVDAGRVPPLEAHFLLVPVGVAIQVQACRRREESAGELIFGELYYSCSAPPPLAMGCWPH